MKLKSIVAFSCAAITVGCASNLPNSGKIDYPSTNDDVIWIVRPIEVKVNNIRPETRTVQGLFACYRKPKTNPDTPHCFLADYTWKPKDLVWPGLFVLNADGTVDINNTQTSAVSTVNVNCAKITQQAPDSASSPSSVSQPVSAPSEVPSNSTNTANVTNQTAQSAKGFVNSQQEVWVDTKTNTMWQNPSSENSMDWEKAKSYCNNLSIGGFTDWRLPDKYELSNIGKNRSRDCHWPEKFKGKCGWYWSSTKSTALNNGALAFSFDRVNVEDTDTASLLNVRCVR